MSTKAAIYTLDLVTNSFIATVVNFDGYLEYTGKTLKENFDDSTLVWQLIVGGEIRSIDEFGDVEYYADRGEDWEDIKPKTFATAEMVEEFYLPNIADIIYYYSPVANGWYFKNQISDEYLPI